MADVVQQWTDYAAQLQKQLDEANEANVQWSTYSQQLTEQVQTLTKQNEDLQAQVGAGGGESSNDKAALEAKLKSLESSFTASKASYEAKLSAGKAMSLRTMQEKTALEKQAAALRTENATLTQKAKALEQDLATAKAAASQVPPTHLFFQTIYAQ